MVAGNSEPANPDYWRSCPLQWSASCCGSRLHTIAGVMSVPCYLCWQVRPCLGPAHKKKYYRVGIVACGSWRHLRLCPLTVVKQYWILTGCSHGGIIPMPVQRDLAWAGEVAAASLFFIWVIKISITIPPTIPPQQLNACTCAVHVAIL